MAISGTHASEPREIYYVKGAIEAILPRCKSYYISDESIPAMDGLTRSLIQGKADAVSSRGLRVVAMAYGFGSVSMFEKDLTNTKATSDGPNLIFAGFQAMMDPPRRGVSDAIASLHSGGVKVVMITGDAVETALAIARQLGLLVNIGHRGSLYSNGSTNGSLPTPQRKDTLASSGCMTGKEIDEMDDRMLIERVGSISVFARTTPRHKMRIVSALQSRGAIVGMTGDGGGFLCENLSCIHSLNHVRSQRCPCS
jgi:P-type Ca2+ transporter type 2C